VISCEKTSNIVRQYFQNLQQKVLEPSHLPPWDNESEFAFEEEMEK